MQECVRMASKQKEYRKFNYLQTLVGIYKGNLNFEQEIKQKFNNEDIF